MEFMFKVCLFKSTLAPLEFSIFFILTLHQQFHYFSNLYVPFLLYLLSEMEPTDNFFFSTLLVTSRAFPFLSSSYQYPRALILISEFWGPSCGIPLDLERVSYFEHSLRPFLSQHQIVSLGSALCHLTGRLVFTTKLAQ